MPTAYTVETLARAFASTNPISSNRSTRPANDNSAPAHTHSVDELINSPTCVDRSADTLKFAGAAFRAGWTSAQIKAVLLDPEKKISEHCLEQGDSDRAADRAIEKALDHSPVPDMKTISASPYVWIPLKEIPTLDWQFGHWILREELTFVIAPGGVGKTTLLAATALSLATGKDFLGKTLPAGRQRVWLWNLEDSIAMLSRSIQATADLHGIEAGDIGDRLFMNTARDGDELITAHRSSAGFSVLQPVHDALVSEILAKKIDVLIVDPFVSSHGGNENDNGEMDRVVKDWCKIAQEGHCSVVLCHHTSKAGSSEVNTMSARGAVAMTAAARVVLVLNPMSSTEASKLGTEEEERWRLIQVTMDKSNRAPLEKADWFRKSSVCLQPGDSAAAVERWTPPQANDMLTPETIALILETFADQDLRKSEQSPDWAGYVVAEALGMDLPDADTPERGSIKKMLNELIKQKQLVNFTGKDNKSKPVPFLRAARPVSPPARVEWK